MVGERFRVKLFGSSGVRGVVNVGLTPVLAARIGLAVATSSEAGKVLVGRDTRVSGLMVEDALVSGFLAGGAEVECLGVVPTPVLAYLTKELDGDAGVMITASHNPSEYNGIKIFDAEGMAYNQERQKEIERMIENDNFTLADWREIGEASSADESYRYLEMVQKSVKLEREWYVVVDPGCGATYHVSPVLLRKLGCKVTAINAQPDGFFPGRSPEPNAESLKPLAEIVKGLGADLGVAYDGDGDRVAFVDDEGRFVDFDRALAAYSAYVIEAGSSKAVVTNVEASMCVERMVEALGGRVIRTKVGDVFVAEAMKKWDAVFGGEPCGAWIHPQFHCCPDGTLSSVLLLKALEDEDKGLCEFVSEVPQFETLRENVACSNDAKYEVMEKIEECLKSTFPEFREVSTVDGVRLSLEEGWVLVRASGTEPIIRLTVEGESLKAADQIMEKSFRLVEDVVGEMGR